MKDGGDAQRKQGEAPSYLYIKEIGRAVKFDLGRFERRGFPEVVLASGKTDDQLLDIVGRVTEEKQPVAISRLKPERLSHLSALLEHGGLGLTLSASSSMLFAKPAGWVTPDNSDVGKVAVVTAGSSDQHAADETMAVLDFLGYAHGDFFDCGIAGMHRTIAAAEQVLSGGYNVAVVFAGMEGALPSVFASLVPIPVIGVPTSTGYGYGGDGVAALNSMLQSCVPGLVTVNIDNGIGAAAAAISVLRSARR